MFCSTTISPIQAASPSPRNSEQMRKPHRVQDHDPDRAPLDRDVERLVVRVPDHLRRRQHRRPGRRRLEQPSRRTRAVADDGRLGKEPQRLLRRIRAASPIDVGLVEFLVDPVIPREPVRRRLQLRRRHPRQRTEHDRPQQDDVGSPFQVRHREHRKHDGQRHQRRARHDDERHVDDKIRRNDVSNSACQTFPSRSSVMIGKASTTVHNENSWLWSI